MDFLRTNERQVRYNVEWFRRILRFSGLQFYEGCMPMYILRIRTSVLSCGLSPLSSVLCFRLDSFSFSYLFTGEESWDKNLCERTFIHVCIWEYFSFALSRRRYRNGNIIFRKHSTNGPKLLSRSAPSYSSSSSAPEHHHSRHHYKPFTHLPIPPPYRKNSG